MTANRKGQDQRVAYGVACTWWGSIYEVGVVPGEHASIPACPACKRALFQVDSELEWWRQIRRHPARNYPLFVEWLRGRCYPDLAAATAAWTAETGLVLDPVTEP